MTQPITQQQTTLTTYNKQQTLTLNKMRQFVHSYNVMEDSIARFNEVKAELDILNAKELDAFLKFIKSGKLNMNSDLEDEFITISFIGY